MRNYITSNQKISQCYSYKLDVRNYFNSIDVELLLPVLKQLFDDDKPLYDLPYKDFSKLDNAQREYEQQNRENADSDTEDSE